jgi:2'-5' RNA ligase
VNGLPAEMIDRWEHRAEPAHGEGLIYWHVLLGGNADVVALAREAQQRLAAFPGLHMTPLRWLHMTVLIAGPASGISEDALQDLAGTASQILAEIPPVTVTLGKVLYHPEAIMLAARPADCVQAVAEAVGRATRQVTGGAGRAGNKLPSTPHVTICYSEARQAAGPVIEALGYQLPARQARIGAVSLVDQRGPERLWDWHVRATIPLHAG